MKVIRKWIKYFAILDLKMLKSKIFQRRNEVRTGKNGSRTSEMG